MALLTNDQVMDFTGERQLSGADLGILVNGFEQAILNHAGPNDAPNFTWTVDSLTGYVTRDTLYFPRRVIQISAITENGVTQDLTNYINDDICLTTKRGYFQTPVVVTMTCVTQNDQRRLVLLDLLNLWFLRSRQPMAIQDIDDYMERREALLNTLPRLKWPTDGTLVAN